MQGNVLPYYIAWAQKDNGYTLPEEGATYDEAMAALVTLSLHFVPKVNALACRHTFRQCLQRTEETVTQYVAALRALAAPYGFGQMEIEMIQDQLIANAYLSAVKENYYLKRISRWTKP